jgi:signal transduction histidine kinase
MADAMRLKQVLINLASNAIKFTPAGGRVAIAAAARQGRVDVSVEDTGIGIRPEDLARLFQPFVQVDGDRTRKTGGTGLGLALSHGLVERMGGRVEATSVPNKGSCFTVSLPSATQPAHKTVRAPVLASTLTGRR